MYHHTPSDISVILLALETAAAKHRHELQQHRLGQFRTPTLLDDTPLIHFQQHCGNTFSVRSLLKVFQRYVREAFLENLGVLDVRLVSKQERHDILVARRGRKSRVGELELSL